MISTSEFGRYVPVLRWKPAEISALTKLIGQGTDTSRLMPLVEPVPERFTAPAANAKIRTTRIDRFVQELKSYCGVDRSLYVDLVQMPSAQMIQNGSHIFVHLANGMDWRSFVPVTGLNRDSAYQSAVKAVVQRQSYLSFDQYARIALRLKPGDFIGKNPSKSISTLLEYIDIEIEQVDLLVDFEWIKGLGYTYSDAYNFLPNVQRWNSITFIGGIWPKYLEDYAATATYEIARNEWTQWQSLIASRKPGDRRPEFGDYTVRHAVFEEPPDNATPSASIRYTDSNKYILMRGEKPRPGGRGNEQYLGHAKMLVGRAEFAGENFSAGDKYIVDGSRQLAILDKSKRKPGSPRQWIDASINHHITFVLVQLAKLSDS